MVKPCGYPPKVFIAMSIYALKPRFQNLLRPAVRALHGKGITANQVTLAACAVSVLLGGVLALAAGAAAKASSPRRLKTTRRPICWLAGKRRRSTT